MSGARSFIAYTFAAVSGICLFGGIAVLSAGRRTPHGEF